jgi:hypothetical protein
MAIADEPSLIDSIAYSTLNKIKILKEVFLQEKMY